MDSVVPANTVSPTTWGGDLLWPENSVDHRIRPDSESTTYMSESELMNSVPSALAALNPDHLLDSSVVARQRHCTPWRCHYYDQRRHVPCKDRRPDPGEVICRPPFTSCRCIEDIHRVVSRHNEGFLRHGQAAGVPSVGLSEPAVSRAVRADSNRVARS